MFIVLFFASASAPGNETDVPSVGQSTGITYKKFALDSSSDTSYASNDSNALVIFKTKTNGGVSYLKKHKKPNETMIQNS